MTKAVFDAPAQVASGSGPTRAVAAYRVSVRHGRLRLAVEPTVGTVLDVPLDRVDARPLGRAGSAVVEVDGSPILLDFTRRSPGPHAGLRSSARRVGAALRGRWQRRRFAAAVRG